MDNTLKKFVTASIAEFQGSGLSSSVFKLEVQKLSEDAIVEARGLIHQSKVIGTANLNVLVTGAPQARVFKGEIIVLLAKDSTELVSAVHANLARMVRAAMPERAKLNYPALAKASIADPSVYLQLSLYLHIAENVGKMPEGPDKATAIAETMSICRRGIEILLQYR